MELTDFSAVQDDLYDSFAYPGDFAYWQIFHKLHGVIPRRGTFELAIRLVQVSGDFGDHHVGSKHKWVSCVTNSFYLFVDLQSGNSLRGILTQSLH
jgi:hypothetical protein